jgi:hypothetical protein
MSEAAAVVALFLRVAAPSLEPSSELARLDAACDGCHVEIANEWAASQHASAYTETPFQVAFAREPRPFCRDCHAPFARGRGPDDPALARGVGCTNCHAEHGLLLAGATAKANGEAPHLLRRAPVTLGEEVCAPCHEFEFPDRALRDAPEFMQSTVREHGESRFASERCVDCHMTARNGHLSHRFEASRDPEFLRSALEVEVVRAGEFVRFRLRNQKAGHAVPTGDMFRRLALVLEPEGKPTLFRYFARHFGRSVQSTGISVLAEVSDNRIPADGSVRELEFRVDPELPVRWSLRHQRVAAPTSFDPRDFPLDGEVEIAHGMLAPEDSP